MLLDWNGWSESLSVWHWQGSLSNLLMTFVCSYFDGDLPEEERLKSEVKSEEEEEEISSGQKKGVNTSQR